ncbi:Protocadherin gamma-A10 [Fukomys damarensis]|uniref:Protocadherin gamma-A10 n=1 Tax=Fukomys damarensis TaxID=885580 RepID=A0A091CKY2_FUKDA|nr:Protocadherin gamma-A10 [Fukomys damarensis]
MGGSCAQRRRAGRGQVLFPFLLPLFYPALCEPVRYSIPEELAKGSVVGNLARDLGLSVQDASARKLRVSAEKLHFSVDAESGDLLVKDRIDREQICRGRRRCELQLEAVVENPLNIFHIVVAIEDINDHAPQFDKKEIHVEVLESVSPGARISLDPATDTDINLNSIKDYHLSSNPYFSLMVRVNSDGEKYPELSLEKFLDREEQGSHRLILTALDGGDPPQSATAQIEIAVKDTNDNPPKFTKDEYRISLSENLPPGSSVLQVTATDADEGINAEISYYFRSALQSTKDMFTLDEKTGMIRNNQSLDFEDVERYTMEVEAKDGGGLSTQCKVLIEILDENDNSPEIVITSLSAQILEDSPPGVVVALFKTRDRDFGENGEVTCAIERDLPFKIYSSSKNYYKLVTDGALDREQDPEYNFTITATDRGKPPLSTSTYITLHITDVNDNAPVFHQASYVVHVAENNPPGVSIAQVSAWDPDSGDNGQVSYSIVASDLEPRALLSYVSVSPQSGVVFAQRAFDHEQLRAFELTLQARDQGSPALSANPGYLVTKVVAVDADSGHNAWLSYHVLQASDPGLFSLGLRTGEVRTARVLSDRDAARHRLLVAVRDGGQPPLSATATLLLVFADSLQEVLPDLADQPVPSEPQAELQFYLVVALALISVLFLLAVILVIALRLRHSSSPTAWGCFQHGLCSKSEPRIPINYEGTLPYSYNLCVAQMGRTEFNFLKCSAPLNSTEDMVSSVQATESPSSHRKKKEPVETYVSRENVGNFRDQTTMAAQRNRSDHTKLVLLCLFLRIPWESRAQEIRYSVPEELDKGSFVGNISKDLGLEPRELAERGVRIVSKGRTQLFSLNPRSGSLVTAGRIDREELCAQSSRCLVSFNIFVEDRVKLFRIEIEVTDINDNAPKFQAENLDVKINENVAPGMRFPLLEAIDPDVGVNSLQSYQLSPSKHFSLGVQSRANGVKYPELVLERALDREEEAVHHLVLTASDGGVPLRSGTVLITVTVFDANDNAPVFTSPEYHVNVPENLPVGTQLLTVTATDKDEGANGEVTYSFRKLPDTQLLKFQLNKNTGEIKISESLDYEETSFYEIEIQAEDGGAYLATAKVLITVEDVNDNRPEVTITSLFSPVTEDSPLGTFIALLNVHDLDSGQNGEITCSIPENLPFKLEKSIDSYYRVVTHRILDREQVSSYNVTVTAKDGGSPPLSMETHFILQVADINDNPPTFSQISYFTYVPENNPRGASIFSVIAHDPDTKENGQVIYSLAEDTIQGAPLSSYISINSDTGVLYALQSFDYEQFRELRLWVTARDSGNPPLSSNASLSLFVLDQNDNTPEILYPIVPTDGSTGVELAPRSAEPGYLVTKVVAVDRDSGQNSWLSYRLLKASEQGLFLVGLHTGEVRTARTLLDRDALKQNLVVSVQDHGQPPLSSTVTLTVVIADSIPEVLADLGNLEPAQESNTPRLTLYLVVAVASVSCVFLAFVIMLLAFRLRRWHKSHKLQASGDGLGGIPTSHFVGVDGVRAFLQTYSHEVSLTSDSRKSHLIFPQPNYADTLISQESCEKKDPLSLLDDSKIPIGDTPLVPVAT